MKAESKVFLQEPIHPGPHEFKGGYPTPETVRIGYDELDFNRAVQAYRFFYATVSAAAIWEGHANRGLLHNVVFGTVRSKPEHVGFTDNSDMPYGILALVLDRGPMLVHLPPGPLIGTAIDLNQQWVADLGITGPDEGRGGTHLLLPPGHTGPVPRGVHAWRSGTFRVLVTLGSIPVSGDFESAANSLTTVIVCPLVEPPYWEDPDWVDVTHRAQDTTPLAFERSFGFWEALNEVIQREPYFEPYRCFYGELAALGMVKGRPFTPDVAMRRILEDAAAHANEQMRIEAFADRRGDRLVWRGRQWEWICPPLGIDGSGTDDLDPSARDKWFFQAVGTSPSLQARSPGRGVASWLGLRDRTGCYLDGGRSYRLAIPQPVPGKFFWSISVYDAETRSQIHTDQGRAAIRSAFELRGRGKEKCIQLYFGPTSRGEGSWIQTLPGRGWFAFLRVYGPESRAFDGSWKPGDFEEV